MPLSFIQHPTPLNPSEKTTLTTHLTIEQQPPPGQRLLYFCGDVVRFALNVDPAVSGKAFVRTNLGHAEVARVEIIRHVEHNEPRLGRDWFDIPMASTTPGRFEARVGLTQVGHFEAKCLFIPDDGTEPHWSEGSNTAINVEPADTICANVIYNTFVRQFGPYKHQAHAPRIPHSDAVDTLDAQHYTVIPPSGTFRDLIEELDFIMRRLGCRIIQLLPINPTPTTYARMGRYGSPYAALDFTGIDPALARFDPKATPLEQFLELVDAIHARSGKLLLDIAINHTGWAASLHETHPHWLVRNHAGEIENPGAWGVVWEDLTRLDFSHQSMWIYMADVFLTWCRRGVDGFRCDAGYMIPEEAWHYIIAKVRSQFPETIFLLEGLGGKISVTRDLLNRANFNWAYSELFQNYDRAQIEHYLPGANEISTADGITVHFAETHDNNRLAATSHDYARMRTALCALLAPFGAFGFANGVEWLAQEKINVHQPCGLNWGADINQVDAIAHLCRLLRTHPAFGHPCKLEFVTHGRGNILAVVRSHLPSNKALLVIANLDQGRSQPIEWDRSRWGADLSVAVDLLTGETIELSETLELAPLQIRCLAPRKESDALPGKERFDHAPAAIVRQRLRAKALEVAGVYRGAAAIYPEIGADELGADPEKFCRRCNGFSDESRVVLWQDPVDLSRHVMVPPAFFLLLRSRYPLRIRLVHGTTVVFSQQSLPDRSGRAFVLVPPLFDGKKQRTCELKLTRYEPDGVRHRTSRVIFLQSGTELRIKTSFSRNDCHQTAMLALVTNGRGAVLRAHAEWQRLESRYDGLLAANLNPSYPEDRRMMLARCRAWIVYQGYSQAVSLDCLERFAFDYTDGVVWHYQVPCGQGEHIALQIHAWLDQSSDNRLFIQVRRTPAGTGRAELADHQAVTLIVRPDIEDRDFHHCTKAYEGPEHQWPQAVHHRDNGFRFAPVGGHAFDMAVDQGNFVPEPEWYYMVHRPLEARRGLDPHSDLFGPGYFSSSMRGGESVLFTAAATDGGAPAPEAPATPPVPDGRPMPLDQALVKALDQYVVRRGPFQTVLAGFPWFLDWGRDTLIVVRGLIAAGRLDTVKAILTQFAAFEKQGTLPNMIRGKDASNRNTSDAPLWLFTACADLTSTEGADDFLDRRCGERTIRNVLRDTAKALIGGTANGIRMDPDSGLIFSPAHFTWMDTNYPAATPRQGYPIEIQALWYAALTYLAQIDPADSGHWTGLAQQVHQAIEQLYWRPELGFLADCRHGRPGDSAADCRPDDALRPNQLLAVTLNSVDPETIGRSVLHACQTLLVPGAIRSLADRSVKTPLEIRRNGHLLNDPTSPYWGNYEGDEDTRRKPAYHNGTAWNWPFPLFCEAWVACYGSPGAAAAMAWLSSSLDLVNTGCVGQLPEIVDGNSPHTQRGCDAQAWSISELLRVRKKIAMMLDERA
jgi:glycogen debranching enzyme